MPELPDLEVFSGNLTKSFKNKKVKQVNVKWEKKLRAPKDEFAKALEGKKLLAVEREGKELRFRFSGSTTMGLHLMLKGKLTYYDPDKEVKYTIIEIIFDDGTGLVVSDFMGQATPTINPKASKVPDALSDSFDVKYFKIKLAKKGDEPIKSVLLDQKVVRGIGNAYADEILYDCKVSPLSAADKIPDAKIKALVTSTKKVLKDAITQIKKADPDIITGELRDFLKVHKPKTKETEKGEKILFEKINSRKSYYTEKQKLY